MEIKIRPWKIEDLDNLVNYANNPKIAKNMTNQFPNPYTKEKGILFIENALKSNPSTIFAIVFKDQAIGGIGLHLQTDVLCKNAELGYWLAEPFWGQGIVIQAINKIVKYGFQTFDINRIYARPFGFNIASQKVLEKSGFTFEACFKNAVFKNEEFTDELYFGIYRN